MNGTINGTEQRPGIVTAISPDIVTVQIQQQSACSGCHARDLCVSSECREHLLQLKTYGQHFSIGEQVLVVARRSVDAWQSSWPSSCPSSSSSLH